MNKAEANWHSVVRRMVKTFIHISILWYTYMVWHENLTVIKFYGLSVNQLHKKLMDFSYTEAQFCARCHGIYIYSTFQCSQWILILQFCH